jgi:hypothetical protein
MKYLKPFNESSITEQQLEEFYGKSIINQYNDLISDIKDRTYDLIDLGLEIKIDWSYSTKEKLDKTPKLEMYIVGDDDVFGENYDEIVNPCIEDIRSVIKEYGFSSGAGFTSTFTPVCYKIVISGLFATNFSI